MLCLTYLVCWQQVSSQNLVELFVGGCEFGVLTSLLGGSRYPTRDDTWFTSEHPRHRLGTNSPKLGSDPSHQPP